VDALRIKGAYRGFIHRRSQNAAGKGNLKTLWGKNQGKDQSLMEWVNMEQELFDEISKMIDQGRHVISAQANSMAILTFWRIGKRINEVILQNKRAEYGKQIVPTLSTQLKEKYGRNFELRNLRRMMQFADEFLDAEIVSTLSTQLSYSSLGKASRL